MRHCGIPSPKCEIFITIPLQGSGDIIEEVVEDGRSQRWVTTRKLFSPWTLQGSGTYKLKKVVTAYTKPVKTQGRQNYSLQR